MHSQQPPGVVQNWSTLQCSKQNTEQCGYDHAPVTRGRMRAQFPLPHGPPRRTRPTDCRYDLALRTAVCLCPLCTLLSTAFECLQPIIFTVEGWAEGVPCFAAHTRL